MQKSKVWLASFSSAEGRKGKEKTEEANTKDTFAFGSQRSSEGGRGKRIQAYKGTKGGSSKSAAVTGAGMILGSHVPYQPPAWLAQAGGVLRSSLPSAKVSLGCFPTPVQRLPALTEVAERGLELWMKRDDLSSFDLSGNKVRKLEFLLADAIAKKCDSVITIGGIQSNHARATAVAARQLGLQPHLILRTTKAAAVNEDPGLVGNLLFDRMVDSKIFTVSPGTYHRIGGPALCGHLEEKLRQSGLNPYVIPVGGSNPLGALGYTECVREIQDLKQLHGLEFDHIVTGCGSGGTVAGLAMGMLLSGMKAQLHAVGVCDTPQYFYDHIEEAATELGMDLAKFGPVTSWCHIYDGQGIGYAKSTDEELSFLLDVAGRTGITLDPVYSGKAFFYFVKRLIEGENSVFQSGQKVLFIHTGGTVGMYDKQEQLRPLLPSGQVEKLDLEGLE